MTPRDFAYWLQGYFEISGPALVLTQDVAAKMLEKANAVTYDVYNEDYRVSFFVRESKYALSSVAGLSDFTAAPAYAATLERLQELLKDTYSMAPEPLNSVKLQIVKKPLATPQF